MMLRIHVCALMAALCLAALPGCGKKPELVPGAESMSDEQKLQKVAEYCKRWAGEFRSAVQQRNLPGIACNFQGVEAHPDGCELQLDKLNAVFEDAVSDVVIYSPVDVGRIKATMLYKLPAGGDPKDAQCLFTLAAADGPNVGFFLQQYRPDPRIFGVLLKGKVVPPLSKKRAIPPPEKEGAEE